MIRKQPPPAPLTINSQSEDNRLPLVKHTHPVLTSNNVKPQSLKTDEEVRVVFLGAAKVGKTALIQRFIHNRFDPKYIPTVEDSHSKKYIVHDRLVRLILVDTAGSFDFPAMFRLYLNKANAFVLVFANDNAESLHQAGSILNQIKLQRQTNRAITNLNGDFDLNKSCIPPMTIVCNKSDLTASDSQISENAIMEWLLSNGLKPSQFVYASAKTNEAILQIFKSLWAQNEATKAIKFDFWDHQNRLNQQMDRPRTPPHTSLPSPIITTDFSALAHTIPNWRESAVDDSADPSPHKPRSNRIRYSLRLSRRSSSKSNKPKANFVRLECVIS